MISGLKDVEAVTISVLEYVLSFIQGQWQNQNRVVGRWFRG
ncbi:hypothetical protein Gotur_025049 [Gossypium turneri]